MYYDLPAVAARPEQVALLAASPFNRLSFGRFFVRDGDGPRFFPHAIFVALEAALKREGATVTAVNNGAFFAVTAGRSLVVIAENAEFSEKDLAMIEAEAARPSFKIIRIGNSPDTDALIACRTYAEVWDYAARLLRGEEAAAGTEEGCPW